MKLRNFDGRVNALENGELKSCKGGEKVLIFARSFHQLIGRSKLQ